MSEIPGVMTYRRRWRGVGRTPSVLVHAVHVDWRFELVADGGKSAVWPEY